MKLTPEDAARVCGVSRQNIYLWIKKGAIPATYDKTGHYVVDPKQLIKAMELHGMFVSKQLREVAG